MSKLCLKADCRAWAMRGQEYCRAHLKSDERGSEAAFEQLSFELPERDFAYGRYRAPVTADEQATLTRLEASSGLRAEIELARLGVLRTLNEDDPVALGKSLLILKTLVMEERKLNGGQAEGLVGSLSQLLGELTSR